jgi:MFS family permease
VSRDGESLQAEEGLRAEQLHAQPVQAEEVIAEHEVVSPSENGSRAETEGVDQNREKGDGSGGGAAATPRSAARSFRLLRDPRFRRLWVAQVVSNLGDWAYVIAVQIGFAATLDGPTLVRATALFFGIEGLTSAVIGMTVAGPIVDRYPRIRVMVLTDLIRCVAVASLLLSGGSAWLHVAAVAAILGACRSLFHPAMMATVPKLVQGDDLVTANGVLTGTYHLAIMAGPAVGAALVAVAGTHGAFALNAASFAVSAFLVIRIHVDDRPATAEPFRPVADLVEGFRYLVRSPIVRSTAIVITLALLLLGAQSPFLVGLVSTEVAPSADHTTWAAIIGAMMAGFGACMVLGSIVTPWLSARFHPRALFVASLCLSGVGFMFASRSHHEVGLVLAWSLCGLSGGVVNVVYETLLQVHTDERFRGRVIATVESAADGAFVVGAAFVAALGATLAPHRALLAVGLAFAALAVIALVLLPASASFRAAEPVATT